MWVLTGPFDGAETAEANFQKSKLLKPGKVYILGRKERALIIKHPRISKDHGEFQVEDFTEDDVLDPSCRPTLRYVDKRGKPMRIDRGQKQLLVEAMCNELLQDGDVVWPIINLKIIVKWEPLCCYYPVGQSKPASLTNGCCSLGIHLVPTPHSEVTHHLISSFAASASIAASLLSASQFVKREWLEEVIRLGSTADDDLPNGTSIESTFALPPLSKYRPSFSPALQDSQKVFKVWEPNEERLNMLKDYRFFLIGENIAAVGLDMRDLIQRGGGSYEFLNAHAGKPKFHKALARGEAKEGQKLVIVGDTNSLKTALDELERQDLFHELELFGLPLISPNTIVQAVINVDTSSLDKRTESGSNAEGSKKPPVGQVGKPVSLTAGQPSGDRPRRLVRSVASRQTSMEPGGNIQEAAPPRRALRRRINDEEPMVADAISAAPTTQPIDLTRPVPTRSAPLKRRRETSEPAQGTDTLQQSPESEPQTKKHKSVFESGQVQDLDVDEMYSQLHVPVDREAFSQLQSQTASETTQKSSLPKLAPVLEEEETQADSQLPNVHRGIKRTAEVPLDTDLAIIAKKQKSLHISDPSEEQQIADKKASGKPPSTRVPSTNKPDIDPAFLKAIASTKRGKKKEDHFDRDFNKLKIARPEMDDRQEEEWNLIDDFGKDTGIRGNFMIIVEMDMPAKEHQGRDSAVTSWGEKPNFKKFKKGPSVRSKSKVELAVSEENDYGLGPSYWKGGNSQSQGSQPAPSQVEVQARITRKGHGQVHLLNEPDDEFEERTENEKQTLKAKRQPKGKSQQPLFLHSNDVESEDDPSTLRSSGGSQRKKRASRSKKKGTTMIVDDDSDDGGVFKGFRGRR